MTSAAVDHPELLLPDAELILPPGASRAAWLKARKLGIGGSDVAALKGESKYGSAYSVWADKTDRTPELIQVKRMRRGQLFEDAIAVEFGEDTGIPVYEGPGLVRSQQFPHALATPDRLTLEGSVVAGLEVKYVESYGLAKKLMHGDFPANWWWQIVAYLMVTGLPYWRLAALVPNQDKLFVRKVERGEVIETITALGPFIEEWWGAHVGLDIAPDDGAPPAPRELSLQLGDAVEALVPAAVQVDLDRVEQIEREQLALAAEEAEIKARFEAEIGNHRYLTANGVRVAQLVHSRGSGKFNRKGLKEKYPDIEGEFAAPGAPFSYIKLIGQE